MSDLTLTEQARLLLCPTLRDVLDEELAAGNTVAEVSADWGTGVLLARPFLLRHVIPGSVRFRPLDDPHYWKSQYRCETTGQTLACRF